MSNIDKIRQEIERRKKVFMHGSLESTIGRYYEDRDLLAFIDSLSEEKPSEDLEEAAENIYKTPFGTRAEDFIAGAEWQAKQLLKGSPLSEDTVLFRKGVEEGRRLERDDLALTWEDIRRIIKIADGLLDNPKVRIAIQNHSEEEYYQKVLDEYNGLHGN